MTAVAIANDILRSLTLDVPEDVDSYATPEDAKHVRDLAEYTDDVIARMQMQPEERGAPMPWQKTRKEIIFRPGELTVWSGDSGVGKSALIMQAMLGLSYRETSLIISPEMPVVATLERAAWQLAGRKDPSPEYVRHLFTSLVGKIWMYDQTGEIEDTRILGVIRWARQELGLTHFVIDSLMQVEFPSANDSWTGNKAEGRFAKRLSDFARDEGVHVHLVAHQRKSNSSNARKDKDEVEGSGKITKTASNVLFLEADTKKAEELEKAPCDQNPEVLKRPDVYLRCVKMRNAPKPNGVFPFWIHPSFQFIDNSSGRPMELVSQSRSFGQRSTPTNASSSDNLDAALADSNF